jgi:hypothetical protein
MIPANFRWPFEIQKIWDFQYFWANLVTFVFFKTQFWANKILSFYAFFYVEICRVSGESLKMLSRKKI